MLRVERKSKAGIVTLYGKVGEGDFTAEKVSGVIDDLNTWVNCKVIKFHMHTYGGSVLEGNVIWNIINKSTVPVDIYIDGIAASMGSILLTAGRRVYMSENGFVMIHQPYSGTMGTANRLEADAALLRAMEEHFICVISRKTGKPEDEIRKLYTSGEDHWFTAKQAKELGIVDEIIPAVTSSIKQLDTPPEANLDQKKMYARFEASLNNLKINDMELKQQLASLLGLQATDDDGRFVAAVIIYHE